MSASLKSLLKGLKNAKCEKGMLPVRQPIPYVPPTDLHKKEKQNKSRLNSQMG
jgi:hypothetical protein